MAPPARPTDEILIEAARAHVTRLFGAARVPRVLIIHIEGVPDPITLPCPLPGPVVASVANGVAVEPWVPTDAQACILEALAGAALRTDALATKSGVARSQLFRHPGGLKEMQERGLVAHHSRVGYYRPDCPPDELQPSQ